MWGLKGKYLKVGRGSKHHTHQTSHPDPYPPRDDLCRNKGVPHTGYTDGHARVFPLIRTGEYDYIRIDGYRGGWVLGV